MVSIFVLKDKDTVTETYYHCHGPFRDMQLVVKQTSMKYACRFPSKKAAEKFKDGLPCWLQGRYAVKELSGWDQLTNGVSPIQIDQVVAMEGGPLGLMYCFD